LSECNNALQPQDGVDTGFFLPPPHLFTNLQNDQTKANLICTWLKLRHVLLHCLTVESRRLSIKQWRTLVSVGNMGPAPSNPKKVAHAMEMHDHLHT
ncbi:hypothetical protein L218DRAFT_1038198, partial [Marasmius fiardii PR-910]